MHRSILAGAIVSTAAVACSSCLVNAADWTTLGGDAGMTKYSPDNINGTVHLNYTKQFYSPYDQDAPATSGYWFASTILIKNGTASVFSSDAPLARTQYFGSGIPVTLFNYSTGQTTSEVTSPNQNDWANLPFPPNTTYNPYSPSGKFSIRQGENQREVDSSHDSETVVWAPNGKIYVRRGGDTSTTASFDPSSNAWERLVILKGSPNLSNYNNLYEGDANAFMQVYGNQLIYRPGDTRQTSPYVSVDLTPTAMTSNGIPGPFQYDVGPNIPPTNAGQLYDGFRYGDIPKVTTVNLNGVPTPVSIISGLSTTSTPTNGYQYSVITQATNLTTGAPLWSNTFSDNGGGNTGYYTSTGNYWRFVASNTGTFVMQTGTTTDPADPRVIRALDTATGATKWTDPMPAGTVSPLFATKANDLYVIGSTGQEKLNLTTGAVEWTKSNSFYTDYDYTVGEDPVYRSLVLTDGTLWFVSGYLGVPAYLVGMNTTDGSIVQEINLSDLVSATPGQVLWAVNDLAEANGQLSVLVGIHVLGDPHILDSSGGGGLQIQKLFTFTPTTVPEPAALSVLALAGVPVLRRRRLASSR